MSGFVEYEPARVAVTTLDDLFSAQFFVMTNCACSSCTPNHNEQEQR